MKMNREEFIGKLQACYFGDRNAFNEIVSVYDELNTRIDKAMEYIEKDTRWFDSEYASIYGELCTCAGAKGNRLEVLVNPSNLLEILNGDNK